MKIKQIFLLMVLALVLSVTTVTAVWDETIPELDPQSLGARQSPEQDGSNETNLTADGSPPATATFTLAVSCASPAACFDGGGSSPVAVTSSDDDDFDISNMVTGVGAITHTQSGLTLRVADVKKNTLGNTAVLFFDNTGLAYILTTNSPGVSDYLVTISAAGPGTFTDGEIGNYSDSGNMQLFLESNDAVPADVLYAITLNGSGSTTTGVGYAGAAGSSIGIGSPTDTSIEQRMWNSIVNIDGSGYAVGGYRIVGADTLGAIIFFDNDLSINTNNRQYDGTGVTAYVTNVVQGVGDDAIATGFANNDVFSANTNYDSTSNWVNQYNAVSGVARGEGLAYNSDGAYILVDHSTVGRVSVQFLNDGTGAQLANYISPSTDSTDPFGIVPLEDGTVNEGALVGTTVEEGGGDTQVNFWFVNNGFAGVVGIPGGGGFKAINGGKGNKLALDPLDFDPGDPNNAVAFWGFNAGGLGGVGMIGAGAGGPALMDALIVPYPVGAGGAAMYDDMAASGTSSGDTMFLMEFDYGYNGTVPEFSAGTLLLALLASGFLMMFVMRRNQ